MPCAIHVAGILRLLICRNVGTGLWFAKKIMSCVMNKTSSVYRKRRFLCHGLVPIQKKTPLLAISVLCGEDLEWQTLEQQIVQERIFITRGPPLKMRTLCGYIK